MAQCARCCSIYSGGTSRSQRADRLKYLGEDPNKGYHRYHLFVDRPVDVVEFTPLGDDDVNAMIDAMLMESCEDATVITGPDRPSPAEVTSRRVAALHNRTPDT